MTPNDPYMTPNDPFAQMPDPKPARTQVGPKGSHHVHYMPPIKLNYFVPGLLTFLWTALASMWIWVLLLLALWGRI